MTDFFLWLEARKKKKKQKIKPAVHVSYEIDAWFKELDLLAKDLKELQQAQKKLKNNQIKKTIFKK